MIALVLLDVSLHVLLLTLCAQVERAKLNRLQAVDSARAKETALTEYPTERTESTEEKGSDSQQNRNAPTKKVRERERKKR